MSEEPAPDPKADPKAEAKARKWAEKAMGLKLPKTMHCTFCGKSQHKVKMLIAGPGSFICDECVGLCNTIISGGQIPDYSGFKPLERPTEDLLEQLGTAAYATEASRNFLQSLVDTLRKREVSWAAIAAELGVSRQAAWERFS